MSELIYLKGQAQLGKLRLLCFCKRPDKDVACHGDVIKSCLEWMIETSRSDYKKLDQ